MRAFLGIDFDNDVKKGISDLQQKLRTYTVKGRWKYVDNYHLTLKFLDEISPKQKLQIDSAMKELCASISPFKLTLSGIGMFPGRDSVRVLWIGLSGDMEHLQNLYAAMEDALSPVGFRKEKRSFSPHITIGQDIILETGFDELKKAIGEVRFASSSVSKLNLFKSEQVQTKRIYTKVSEYDLLA